MSVALAVLPLAYLVWFCMNLSVDVPFYDQWELVPKLDKAFQGTLTLRDLWEQHNEHRPMIPIALMVLLARISGWNIHAEVAVNVLLGIGILLVYVAHLRHLRQVPWWALPVLSVLTFSTAQWENWLWGWQIQILMGTLASVAGAYFLSRDRAGAATFAAALICGIVATYSFASGLAYWVVGPVALLLNPRHRTRARVLLWVLVGGLTIATYFYDYHAAPGHPSLWGNFTSLSRLSDFGLYIANYLGGSVGINRRLTSVTFGLCAAAAFALLLRLLWQRRHQPEVLFPVLMALQVAGAAVLSSLGRSGMGVDQALASRYTTLSAPLWIAVLLMTMNVAGAGNLFRRYAAAAVAAFIVVASLATGRVGGQSAQLRSDFLRPARIALRDNPEAHMMLRVYPAASVVLDRRPVLERWGLSVFRR